MIKDNVILKPTVCVNGVCFGKEKKTYSYLLRTSKNPQDLTEFRIVGIVNDKSKYSLIKDGG
jgi:hypothetical protein